MEYVQEHLATMLNTHAVKTESEFSRHRIKKYRNSTVHTIPNFYPLKTLHSGDRIQKLLNNKILKTGAVLPLSDILQSL